ncbi:hypothetical protein EIN_198060 [Entamoeba invadens IP1]|uniref:SPRY domain containing protein n=1 Tax=Entamoeba invadens IP1 TaxID=370355 RepID=A0A0A1TWZ4_ENTIV|nr:hypothetical protein EIN_198060 [Entamoeba invadens IP1]ELP83853.1 hypothetical protein EIN_198060 [Entamoeba invadens IP1]|eukprot:XP_004183199.1 hypothetical protein EIN_198060 [Entamoeba invadens IP1]
MMQKEVQNLLIKIAQKVNPTFNPDFEDYEHVILPYYLDAIMSPNQQTSPSSIDKMKVTVINGEMKTGFYKGEYIITNMFPTLLSNFGATTGKYVYQVIIQVDGLLQIGICESTESFDNSRGIGDFSDSYAYDGYRKCLWNGKQIPFGSKWKQGDVVSICVDFDNKTMKVFLNEKDCGIAFTDMGTEPPKNTYFGVTGSVGSKFIVNYGEFPLLFREKFPEYTPVAQQPTKSADKEGEALKVAILECLNDESNASVLVLEALFTRFMSLVVNSKVICVRHFITLLFECHKEKKMQKFVVMLKHLVHESDIETIFDILMEWYYVFTSHFTYDNEQTIQLTQLIVEFLNEMMNFACKNINKLFQFIDIIFTKTAVISFAEYTTLTTKITLAQPPEELLFKLNEKHKKQLENDETLLKALDANKLLDEFIRHYSLRHNIADEAEDNDGAMEVTLRITFALFDSLLKENKPFVFNNKFLFDTPKQFEDFDRLGGTVSYLKKTFPIKDNDADYEYQRRVHRAVLFFYNNTIPFFSKIEIVCRKMVGITNTLERDIDWLDYLWMASSFIVPCRFEIQQKMFEMIVNAMNVCDAVLFVHEPYLSTVVSLCRNLRQMIVFKYQQTIIQQLKEPMGVCANMFISFLNNKDIAKPGLNTTIFLSLALLISKLPHLVETITPANRIILFEQVFKSFKMDEEDRYKRAMFFIRIAFPVPFYQIKGNVAEYNNYKNVMNQIIMEYFKVGENAMETHKTVLEFISKNLDQLLLLLDKERLNNEEIKAFELLTSNMLSGTDLLDALSFYFGKLYTDHALATKFLQYLTFVLYQCTVRNGNSRRGRMIHNILVSLRLLLLNALSNILNSMDQESRMAWFLQDGLVTQEIAKGIEGIEKGSTSIFSFDIDYQTASWDRWRTPTYTEQILTDLKVFEKEAMGHVMAVVEFIKSALEEKKKKGSKTVTVTPSFRGRASETSFEMEVEEDEDKLCFICCSNNADTIMLPCKHSMCATCIERYMENHNECPFCKAKIEGLKKRSEMGMDGESSTKNI